MNNTEIKKKLFHPSTDKWQFIGNLKYNSNYSNFSKIIRALKKHPFSKSALDSSALPKELKDLRKNTIQVHSGNIESEIAWMMSSIRDHSKKISDFIDYKLEYERLVLLNNYDDAEKILNKIENEICFSNWGIENRLLLTEERDGTEQNWLLLSKYNQSIKDPLSAFFAQQSSKKAEEKFSYSRYKKDFDNLISDTGESFHEYLCFKILHNGYIGFSDYSFIINAESTSSIIDRYIVLIDVLIELRAKNKGDFIKSVVYDLKKEISNDLRLVNLSNILSDEFDYFSDKNEIVDTIDDYSKGNYQSCIDKAPDLISRNPLSIELYVIYIKSLIETGSKVIPTFDQSENINQILIKLFNVFNLNEQCNSSLDYLVKTSIKYYSFNFGKQLFTLISELTELGLENNVLQFYSYVNSVYNNAKIVNYLNPAILQSDKLIIDSFSKIESISSKINISIANGSVKELKNESKISPSRKKMYLARAMFVAKDYDGVINLIESSLKENNNSIPTHKDLIELVYNVYLIEKKVEKAVTIYVDNFFKNQYLVQKLNEKELVKLIQAVDINSTAIETPIFYLLANEETYELYVKYDEYLIGKGFDKPTELIRSNIIEDKLKLIFFLREVCNIDVMHHSLYFEGTEDIEYERVEILKHLLVIDEENEGEYIKEITEITQKSKIRKAIRAVNKGRITINTQQLKSKEENNIKNNYSRFQELLVFSENHDTKTLDFTSKILNEYFRNKSSESLNPIVLDVNDPAFISFKTMFIDLRDKFLLSKDFGLDGYLSTRIRHGTFLNHIRSVFESFNLISQKRDGEYIENEFWLNRIPANLSHINSDLQKSIKDFSQEIDELTQAIIVEFIQVKTEKINTKENALFDFSINDALMLILYQESKVIANTHTDFLNYVFEYLEETTKKKLSNIREIFKNQIKQEYVDRIVNFDNNVRKLIKTTPFIDLTSSISKCQTNIINELENISEWFNISNPTSDLILNVETIIQTALEITNTIYPNEKIEAVIEDKTEMSFGKGTTNLIYIIRILLDNIIKHSGLTRNDRNVKITANIEGQNTLKLSVYNHIDPKQIETTKLKLSDIKNEWSVNKNDYSKINIEGGSGFDKIRRILAVDMQIRDYEFNFELNNDTVVISIQMGVIQA